MASDSGDHTVVATEGATHMLCDIADLFLDPEAYICVWRDGELYIEAIASLGAASSAA
jgi:hypothetical protein